MTLPEAGVLGALTVIASVAVTLPVDAGAKSTPIVKT
jgi:hypothetical protein